MSIDRSKTRWSNSKYEEARRAFEAEMKKIKYKAPELPENAKKYKIIATAKKKELKRELRINPTSEQVRNGAGGIKGVGNPPKGFIMSSGGEGSIIVETKAENKKRKAVTTLRRNLKLEGALPSKAYSKALFDLNNPDNLDVQWPKGKDAYGNEFSEKSFRKSLQRDRNQMSALVKRFNERLGPKTVSKGHNLEARKGGTDAASQVSLEPYHRNVGHEFEGESAENRIKIDAGDTDANALRAYLLDGHTRGYVNEADKIRILTYDENADKVLSRRDDKNIQSEIGLTRDRNVSQDEFESGKPLAFDEGGGGQKLALAGGGQVDAATRALDTAGDVRNLQRIGMGLGRHKAGLLSSYFTMQNAHRALQEARAPGANWQDKVQAALYGVEAALDVSAAGAAVTGIGAAPAVVLEGASVAAGLTGDLSEAVQYFTSKEGRGALESIWKPIYDRSRRIWNRY